MIKGAIFDMDGLMFDTERLSTIGWREAGIRLGYPIDDNFINSIRGTNRVASRRMFNEAFEGADYDLARKVHAEVVESIIEENGMPIKPGLFELLDYLKESGIVISVATSTSRESAERHLKRAKVYGYFDAYTYGDMVENGKPAPDIFLKAAELLGVKPQECIVFEDSPNGIRAGRAAGMCVAAVPDLDPIIGELEEMTDVVFTTLDEAIEYIDKINKSR